ncbi:MAG: class I SAM-dependent methyltransferase [Spirochaetales bacterium]|nr:class I SAM-dependent methyltransferase [Spirochaetales bacterium]MCP5484930.1 class I SAM-dependent methyltransferase [Spirochaetales bacterium]
MGNIHYSSKSLVEFYKEHRFTWRDLYPSERWIFERVFSEREAQSGPKSVLDVGCACGGLYAALSERFSITAYAGIDINQDVIEWAAERFQGQPANFQVADIAQAGESLGQHDVVASLSCADWNIETRAIIESCWKAVAPGGVFIVSLRLTDQQGVNDIESSYQIIEGLTRNLEDQEEDDTAEKANYVVLNWRESLKMLGALKGAKRILKYGYWGKPSASATTPFERLCFTVCAVYKDEGGESEIASESDDPGVELYLPLDLLSGE